jgi:sodium/potassium/calcium exchanger 6
VNDYFCAGLTLAVDWLQLSPNIAGVAFLALGNAAPGVIASIAAFASNSPKVGIGTTLGAGIFDSCAVIGVVTFVGDVRLPRRSFVRDVLFFIVAVVYLFAVAFDGLIDLRESIGFVGTVRRCLSTVRERESTLRRFVSWSFFGREHSKYS